VKITKVLGTDELYAYLEKYDIELDAQYDEILGRRVGSFDTGIRLFNIFGLTGTRGNRGLASLPPRISGISQTKPLIFWTNSSAMTTRTVSPLVKRRRIPILVCSHYCLHIDDVLIVAIQTPLETRQRSRRTEGRWCRPSYSSKVLIIDPTRLFAVLTVISLYLFYPELSSAGIGYIFVGTWETWYNEHIIPLRTEVLLKVGRTCINPVRAGITLSRPCVETVLHYTYHRPGVHVQAPKDKCP
jgi:hypothetical protein